MHWHRNCAIAVANAWPCEVFKTFWASPPEQHFHPGAASGWIAERLAGLSEASASIRPTSVSQVSIQVSLSSLGSNSGCASSRGSDEKERCVGLLAWGRGLESLPSVVTCLGLPCARAETEKVWCNLACSTLVS